MGTYNIVDTAQTADFDNSNTITKPSPSSAFYGQDADYQGLQPHYQNNGNGTITDLNTGLTWAQSVATQEMTWAQALSYAESAELGGYSDWRLPSIKELYSLIEFTGNTAQTAAASTPYIDTQYFNFSYGDTSAGERIIDAQEWSSTKYVSTTMNGDPTAFGVNFADGRIKGYPISIGSTTNTLNVRLVRGNTDYGKNAYVDNGDGTITDTATGLMWLKNDSGSAMTWEKALAYAEAMTAAGHGDWRLPNAKELQSIVDYTRSPDTTGTAAIDPVFQSTNIGTSSKAEYGFYWSGTSHVEAGTGDYAVYVAFGRGLGWMQKNGQYTLMDVHGAGSQRSDPKSGSAADYPHGFGPQGDVIRIENMVRLVRDVGSTTTDNTSTFVSSSGNDQGYVALGAGLTVDAGQGYDVLQLHENRSAVTLTKNGTTLTLSRTADGSTLAVQNAETVLFDSGEVVALAHNNVEAIIGRLFQAFLDRDMSASEWQAVRSVSTELYAGRVSALAVLDWFNSHATTLSSQSNSQYIQTVYQQTFGRAVTNSELSTHLAQFDNHQIDRNTLAVTLAASNEAVTTVGSVMLFETWQ